MTPDAPLVHVVVNVGFDGPLRRLTERWDGALAPFLSVVTYQALLTRSAAPAATYVFTDFERVPRGDRDGVLALWDTLQTSGRVHLLNDPRRCLQRFDLLRALFDQGLNDFNVYRAGEDLGAARFPVFVRCEHDHGGPRTPLLHSPAELRDALARLGARRAWRSQLLVTECAATADDDGLFRKYGALLIGDRVVPWHVIASRTWLVKGSTRVTNDRTREDQRRYIAENPHEDLVRRAFAAANIEYGRIDYGVVDGRLRVYEINTNPAIGGPGRHRRRSPGSRSKDDPAAAQLVDAFAALARRCPAPGTSVPLTPHHTGLPAWVYQRVRAGQGLVARYVHRSGIR